MPDLNDDKRKRLVYIMDEVHDLLMRLDPDEEADADNPSPPDMTQHVTGLAIRLVREAKEIVNHA